MPNVKSVLLSILIISIFANAILIYKVVTEKNPLSFTTDKAEINFAFSSISNNPKKLLLQSIKEAAHTMDIAIYNIKDKDIAEAILRAKNRGVSVRILTDATKSESKKQAAVLDEFLRRDIEVKVHSEKKMHLKMAIIDKRLIVTGSYNFTEESATENIEQLITIANQELAEQWTKTFDTLWNQNAFEHYR